MLNSPRPSRIEEVTEILRSRYTGAERDWLPPERALARELEVSRPLLREAIKRLQMQGYLKPIHGVGVKIIHEPNAPIKALLENELSSAKDRHRQFSDLRKLVEPQMAAWAAENASTHKNQLRKLRILHESMETAPTYEDQVKIDIKFHRAIAELAANQILTLMLSAVADIELQNRSITLAAVGVNQSYAQHDAILLAIESGDAKAAQDAMQIHIDAACAKSLQF